MKYINKTLTDDEGEAATCHVAVMGQFSLIASSAGLKIKGYKDAAAYVTGKRGRMETSVPVDLGTLTTTCGDMPGVMTVYEALWTIISMRLISDEASPFFGGEIKDTEAAPST